MTDDRDLLVAKALRDLPVPEHGPEFWRELEARLATEEAPSAPAPQRTPAATSLGARVEHEVEAEDDDLPIVVALADRRRPRSVVWLASLAAVLALVVAATVTLTSREPDAERVRMADPSPDGPEAPTPTEAPTTSTAPPVAGADGTPEEALLEWIEAVGAGELEAAAALTGPRSKAYADALTGGAGIEGFLLEAGEGYGAWADSPDRSTTEVELDVAGEDVTVVILSGTWTGEGGTGFRTVAIPVVRSSGGAWLVEPWAIDPGAGGRITVTSPSPAEAEGFDGLAPDGTLSAAAPGGGTFHFSLDDQPATAVVGQKAAGGVRATFDPPGALASRTHLFVIAYVDGPTISTVAGTFAVEG